MMVRQPGPGSAPSGRLAILAGWAERAGFSVLDQGLLSGANFLLGVFAARWLSQEEFGAFAVAFATYLFALGLNSALVTEPMRVLMWKRGEDPREYRRAVNWLQVICSLVAGILLALVALVLHGFDSPVWRPLLALAVFAPVTLGLYFLRLGCYLHGRARSAVRISLIYAVTLLVGAAALRHFGTARADSIVLLMGVSALVAVLSVGTPRLYQRASVRPRWTELQSVIREHWHFGRWLAASSISYWLGAAAYLPLSAGLIGLDAAGAMRAVQALFQPLEQIIVSLGMLFLPAVARRRPSGGVPVVRLLSRRISAIYVTVAATYVALLWPISGWVLNKLYAGRYDDHQWMVPVFGLSSMLACAAYGLVLGLNALERTDAVFFSRVAGAIASLVIGIPLLVRWQLPGAAAAVMLSSLVVLLVAGYFHRRILGSRSTPNP